MSNQAGFLDLNKVMFGILEEAFFYLRMHDKQFKQYCLQSAAWNGIKRVQEIVPILSEPFLTPVNVCLSECAAAKAKMPELNIRYPDYAEAAKNLTALAEQIDQILESNNSFKEGVGEDDFSSHKLYVRLGEMAAETAQPAH